MTVDDELSALRARVYGPDAGTQPDAEAIRRLRDLEAARRPTAQPVSVEVADTPEPAMASTVEPIVEPPEPRTRAVLRWLRGLRRSTVLILVAVTVFIVALAVTLTLVQRVQTDPLQTGAQQVARLGVDPMFRVPVLFRGGANGEVAAQGFQQFQGLRPVVTESGFFGSGTDDPCLSVYPDAIIEDPDTESFSGPLIGGCAVGGFPAIAQFSSDLEGFPEELLEAYPESGLQFVYDRVNNDVVVFVSEG